MSKKDISIGIATPWGVSLMHKELKHWADVDIKRFMQVHHVVVRTSKENFNKAYRFKLVAIECKTTKE
jgi:hypothetical protein